ncbi:hypothetical protein [Microcoleus vaginatus]|uniref:hypothetical protein n=1 Tax=Microcoleus vaginatus TaxID=119532 RepID=UPI001F60B1DC
MFFLICHAEDTVPKHLELYLDSGEDTREKVQRQRQIKLIGSSMQLQSETGLLHKYSLFNRSEKPMESLASRVSTSTTSEPALK